MHQGCECSSIIQDRRPDKQWRAFSVSCRLNVMHSLIHSFITTCHAGWRIGQQWSSPTQPVTGQPLDGAPGAVHVLQFLFHGSSPACLWSTTLPLSLWGPVDCNFVMELASLCSTYPVQRHRFLVVMVSVSPRWHRAKRSRLEMVLGQKMRWVVMSSYYSGIYCLPTEGASTL